MCGLTPGQLWHLVLGSPHRLMAMLLGGTGPRAGSGPIPQAQTQLDAPICCWYPAVSSSTQISPPSPSLSPIVRVSLSPESQLPEEQVPLGKGVSILVLLQSPAGAVPTPTPC